MSEIIEVIAELLQIDYSIISEYSYQSPFHVLFYIIILPSIILLLFLFIFFRNLTDNPKINMLLTSVIFIAILLNGWFKYFIFIGKIWLYLMIFLGILWFITGHKKGAKTGEKIGSVKSMNPFGQTIFGKIGGATLSINHGKRLAGRIDKNLNIVEKMLSASNPNYPDAGKLLDSINRMLEELWNIANSSKATLVLVSDYNKLVKKYERLNAKFKEKVG